MSSKILVPIKGGPVASETCSLARALRGKIQFVHVVRELFADYTLPPPVGDDVRVLQAVRIEA